MLYTIDATNKKLGRLASEIAQILQGKKSPDYEPRLESQNRVLIKNVAKIVVTGKKVKDKIYYRHTGYMGHLRQKTFEMVFAESPEKVLARAVYNMLPKNRLRSRRMKRLKIEK